MLPTVQSAVSPEIGTFPIMRYAHSYVMYETKRLFPAAGGLLPLAGDSQRTKAPTSSIRLMTVKLSEQPVRLDANSICVCFAVSCACLSRIP